MTPEERNLVMELFNRLTTLENAQRDPEAERLIEEGLRYAPKAPYALVQTVLVQDEALKRADARIRELEGGAAEPRDSGGFLGSMRDSLFGRGDSRGSVPSVRAGEDPGGSPAWRTGTQPMAGGPGAGPMAPGAGGGSFLGTAAAAAAGVIGGSMLLGGIRSAMGQPGSAQGAHNPSVPSDPSPWQGGGSGGDLARQVGLDKIGRPPAGEEGGRRGLFDHGRADETAADQDDDPEDDDFDDEDEDEYDDDGGEEE
jgi:hypothetical protein